MVMGGGEEEDKDARNWPVKEEVYTNNPLDTNVDTLSACM